MDARMQQEDAGYTKDTLLTTIRDHRDLGESWPKSVSSAIDLRGHTAWKLLDIACATQRVANRLCKDIPASMEEYHRDESESAARIEARQLRRGHGKVLQDWQDAGFDREVIEKAAKLLEVEAPVAS